MKLKPVFAGAAVALAAFPVLAADPALTGTVAAGGVDLTGITVAVVGGVFSVIGAVLVALINARMKDQQAAETLDKAIGNSLGAMQQAAQGEITTLAPHVTLPGVTANLAPAVQYVLDHAGEAAKRFGITPEAIADKVNARLGLANIATNLAVTASSSPEVIAPLAAAPMPPTN